jgi:hypothetical protein
VALGRFGTESIQSCGYQMITNETPFLFVRLGSRKLLGKVEGAKFANSRWNNEEQIRFAFASSKRSNQ